MFSIINLSDNVIMKLILCSYNRIKCITLLLLNNNSNYSRLINHHIKLMTSSSCTIFSGLNRSNTRAINNQNCDLSTTSSYINITQFTVNTDCHICPACVCVCVCAFVCVSFCVHMHTDKSNHCKRLDL